MEDQVRITIVHRDGDVYVARCPDLDMAREGDSVEDAKANLRDAIADLLDTAGDEDDPLDSPNNDWRN